MYILIQEGIWTWHKNHSIVFFIFNFNWIDIWPSPTHSLICNKEKWYWLRKTYGLYFVFKEKKTFVNNLHSKIHWEDKWLFHKIIFSCRRHSIYGGKTSLHNINLGGRNTVENGLKTVENRRKWSFSCCRSITAQ